MFFPFHCSLDLMIPLAIRNWFMILFNLSSFKTQVPFKTHVPIVGPTFLSNSFQVFIGLFLLLSKVQFFVLGIFPVFCVHYLKPCFLLLHGLTCQFEYFVLTPQSSVNIVGQTFSLWIYLCFLHSSFFSFYSSYLFWTFYSHGGTINYLRHLWLEFDASSDMNRYLNFWLMNIGFWELADMLEESSDGHSGNLARPSNSGHGS